MALDFPNSPTTGQIFNGWQWNGTAWIALGIASGASVTVGDTAPATPKVGDLWWDSVSGQLFVWFQDATSSQWVISVGNPGAVGPVGPAGPAGPNILPPGVTNGSNAAAGQVGEYIVVNYSGTGLAEIVPTTLVVPPGDWEVGFDVYMSQTFNSPYIAPFWGYYGVQVNPSPVVPGLTAVSLTDTKVMTPTNTTDNGATWASMDGRLSRSGARANITVTTTFTMSITVAFMLAGIPAAATRGSTVYMWARRMR